MALKKRKGRVDVAARRAERAIRGIEDLTVSRATMMRIRRKRKRYSENFEAFCHERLQINDRDDPTGAKVIPFKWNAAQRAFMRNVKRAQEFRRLESSILNEVDPSYPISEKPISFVVLKARKVGMSTLIEARAFWIAEFNEGAEVGVIAHKEENARNILKITRNFVNKFVDDKTTIRRRLQRSTGNIMEWSAKWGSSMVVKTAGASGGSSRGYTFHLLHISEEAHFPDDNDELTTAFNARVKYHETYEESTANGAGGQFYDTWEHAIDVDEALRLLKAGKPMPADWNGRFRFFWSWLDDPGYQVPLMPGEAEALLRSETDAERELRMNFGASPEQIKWRRQMMGSMRPGGVDPEEYWNQEFPHSPEVAFITKGSTIFHAKRLQTLIQQSKKIKFQGYRVNRYSPIDWRFSELRQPETGEWRVWEKPRPGHHYIIGIDTAEGKEHGDFSVVSVFDRTDGTHLREVARFQGKSLGPDAIGEFGVYVALLYNEAYLIAERMGPGIATCEAIFRMGYRNTYVHKDETAHRNEEVQENLRVGFTMSPRSKDMVVEAAARELRDGFITLKDPRALREWRMFRRNKAGRPEAPKGEHDDCVVADCLAIWAHSTRGVAPIAIRRKMKERDPAKDWMVLNDDDAQDKQFWDNLKKLREKNRKQFKRQAAQQANRQRRLERESELASIARRSRTNPFS